MCVRRYVHGDRRENVNAGKGSGCVEGSVNVMGRKGGNRLFPTLTLTLTFHHPEQSLLHKLHWLDHVIRVGVFSVKEEASSLTLNTPTLIT